MDDVIAEPSEYLLLSIFVTSDEGQFAPERDICTEDQMGTLSDHITGFISS